jgi:hypothetical protein
MLTEDYYIGKPTRYFGKTLLSCTGNFPRRNKMITKIKRPTLLIKRTLVKLFWFRCKMLYRCTYFLYKPPCLIF